MFKLVLYQIAAFHLMLSLSASIHETDLVITLPDGQIKGTTYVTQNNKTYYGFQGIPYAYPPIGTLRFEAPQKPIPWTGVLDATKDGKACISTKYWTNLQTQSEDCLFINVYSPALTTTELLPVMVWIYGGSFTSGSSSKLTFGPDFLVEEDVIVVSFNYRLGPFGFLSTGDTAIRGNAGLKDQSLALKWTNENIAYFGGDPEKITVFGQSAGAASVGLHLLNKKSTGLFRAAILESGSAINYWTIDRDPKSYTSLFADAITGGSYNGTDTQQLKILLQEKSAEEIINASISLISQGQTWPVLEVEGEEAFIADSPYELLRTGQFNQVPILTGICSQESLLFLKNLEYATELAHYFDSVSGSLVPTDLRPNASDEALVSSSVREIYLKAEETFADNLVAFVNIYGDNAFTRPALKSAELLSNFVPVYLYQFAYYGRPITPAYIDGAEKVGHAGELPFIFNMVDVSNTTSSADLLTQNRLTKLWTNFAKFLNPTPEKIELFNNVIWSNITTTNQQFLNINNTIELRSDLKEEIYSKWNHVFETYGKKPFITY